MEIRDIKDLQGFYTAAISFGENKNYPDGIRLTEFEGNGIYEGLKIRIMRNESENARKKFAISVRPTNSNANELTFYQEFDTNPFYHFSKQNL